MNLHFLFEGKLSREEVSSAILAIYLEQNRPFRDAFIALLNNHQSDKVGVLEDWDHTVVTEEHDIDILMKPRVSGGTTFLLENKVKNSAYKKGQFKRYVELFKENIPLLGIYLSKDLSMSQKEAGLINGKYEGVMAVGIQWKSVLNLIKKHSWGEAFLELERSLIEGIEGLLVVKQNSKSIDYFWSFIKENKPEYLDSCREIHKRSLELEKKYGDFISVRSEGTEKNPTINIKYLRTQSPMVLLGFQGDGITWANLRREKPEDDVFLDSIFSKFRNKLVRDRFIHSDSSEKDWKNLSIIGFHSGECLDVLELLDESISES